MIPTLAIERLRSPGEPIGLDAHQTDLATALVEGCAGMVPAEPPVRVPLDRWIELINAIHHFCYLGYPDIAQAAGWQIYDLVGCDAVAPVARLDRAGLLWLLKNDRLVGLTTDCALIEVSDGARQTYRRTPAEPGRVLAWELVPRHRPRR